MCLNWVEYDNIRMFSQKEKWLNVKKIILAGCWTKMKTNLPTFKNIHFNLLSQDYFLFSISIFWYRNLKWSYKARGPKIIRSRWSSSGVLQRKLEHCRQRHNLDCSWGLSGVNFVFLMVILRKVSVCLN